MGDAATGFDPKSLRRTAAVGGRAAPTAVAATELLVCTQRASQLAAFQYWRSFGPSSIDLSAVLKFEQVSPGSV